MHDFDKLNRAVDPPIFASEYAVTTDGGWGNLKVSKSVLVLIELLLPSWIPSPAIQQH